MSVNLNDFDGAYFHVVFLHIYFRLEVKILASEVNQHSKIVSGFFY